MAEKKITTIPATLNKFTSAPINSKKKRRVAGYARVSTDQEEQQSSYQAQVDYYTNYIKSRSDWEFAGLYADDGISATSVKFREGFKRMIADAKAGKIDLIITKSVSRFARNTVDSLTTVRELKEIGVEIYFEKENIYTLDSKGELLITIMSSIAQEESRSISENVTWGHRKRFADGKVSFAYSSVLGFDRGPNGEVVVNHEEAKTVRLIFSLFLEGMTPTAIAKELTERGIKSPKGKDKWCQGTVRRMLSNEKYKGCALLQKQFTIDYLTKKLVKNEGQVPQYYVENNHEAIISPQVFDMVQAELERRKRVNGSHYSGVTIFSNKIKCGDCGGFFGSKVWHSNDKYRRIIYRCNRKYSSQHCKTPHVTEDELHELFVSAFNELLAEKKEILSNIEIVRKTLCDTSELTAERERLHAELAMLAEMTRACVEEKQSAPVDQAEYQARYNGLVEKYNTSRQRLEEVDYMIDQKQAQSEKINIFVKALKKQGRAITEFDDALWCSMVDFVTIGRDYRSVTFKDGTEIKV